MSSLHNPYPYLEEKERKSVCEYGDNFSIR